MSESLRNIGPLKRAALRFVHSLEEPGILPTWSIDRARRILGLLVLLNVWTVVLLVALLFELPLSAALRTDWGLLIAAALTIGFFLVFGFWIQADVPGYRPRVEIGLETDRVSYSRHMGIAWYIGVSLVSALLVFYSYANWAR
jgi:hypothetical protein